jgi:hypothetical protein
MTTKQELIALIERALEMLRIKDHTDEQIAQLDATLASILKKIDEHRCN